MDDYIDSEDRDPDKYAEKEIGDMSDSTDNCVTIL